MSSIRKEIKDCLYEFVGFEEKNTVRMVEQILEHSFSLSSFKNRMEDVLNNDIHQSRIGQFCDRLWSSGRPPAECSLTSSSYRRESVKKKESTQSEKDRQVMKRLKAGH